MFSTPIVFPTLETDMVCGQATNPSSFIWAAQSKSALSVVPKQMGEDLPNVNPNHISTDGHLKLLSQKVSVYSKLFGSIHITSGGPAPSVNLSLLFHAIDIPHSPAPRAAGTPGPPAVGRAARTRRAAPR